MERLARDTASPSTLALTSGSNITTLTETHPVKFGFLLAVVVSAFFALSGCNSGSGSSDSTVSAQAKQPVAIDDTSSTAQDSSVVLPVLRNDQVENDLPFTLEIDKHPQKGTVFVEPDNTISYMPDADFIGTDQFRYTIRDIDGNSTTATVTIEVFCAICPEINLTLTWKDDPDVKGYLIYYGNSPDTATQEVADTPIAMYSENLGRNFGLFGGEKVCFRIRSYNNSGLSPLSDPICGVV